MATISAHSIKPIVTSPCNGNDIRELSYVVQSLFRKGKTTNLTVIVTSDLKYTRKTFGDVTHVEPPATQATTQTPRARKRTHTGTVRETTTVRLGRQVVIEEQIETGTGNYVLALTTRLQCADKTCPHYGYSCYPFGRSHLFLDNNDIRTSNEMIRSKKDVTIEHCLQEVLANAVNRRQKAEGKKARGGSGGLPRKEQPFGGIDLTINTGEYRGGPHSATHTTELRSSPPTFEGSEMQNLRDYMAWLIATGHATRELGSPVEVIEEISSGE